MIGCLCIHGFTGAPYEVDPLVHHLRQTTNWFIKAPTLPGHGEQLQLKGVTYTDWIGCAEKELQELLRTCEHVYLVGFSMGGLIASYLATKYSIKKLVLLSAAAYYVNPKQLLLDVRKMITDGINGKIAKNELFLRYKKKISDTPIQATLEFKALVSSVRPKLKEVVVPTLIIQGECDGIVPAKSAHYLYNTIGSTTKKLCFLPSSKHHVCHGDDQERLFKEIDLFLKNE